MTRTNTKKSTARIAIIIGVVIAITIIAVLVRNKDRSGGIPEPGSQVIEDAAPEQSSIKEMSQTDIEEAQRLAAAAAVTGKPVSGTVQERPDFVSEIEWEVFRNVVNNQPKRDDTQLTTLVNKLLFYKKKEAWEASGAATAQRRELARDLLEMLPSMKKGDHITPKEADQLERELYNDLGRAAQ